MKWSKLFKRKNKKQTSQIIPVSQEIKRKRQWLKNNGWYQGWSNEDWLQEGREYSNIDWAGMSTEQAYNYCIKMGWVEDKDLID